MSEIDDAIRTIDEAICGNIDKFSESERGLLSQNVLSQLRNFVEHISLKIYAEAAKVSVSYDDIIKANRYVESRGDLKFLFRFHDLLQISASHYTVDEENSERLMLKYFEYLIRIKTYMSSRYNFGVLANLSSFPVKTEKELHEYHAKIALRINQPSVTRSSSAYRDRFYILKVKPFFVDLEIYYEITFTRASNSLSKFDRLIAFTKLEVLPNYAVKMEVYYDTLDIMGEELPIQVVEKWEVSIRPCEIDSFANIFGIEKKISSDRGNYELMKYMTTSGLTLLEIIDLEDFYYKYIKERIEEAYGTLRFFKILDSCRALCKGRRPGYNVIRYLLYSLNNRIIKFQRGEDSCGLLSNLVLKVQCVPFDKVPFYFSLKDHNPKLSILFACLDFNGREHELLARHVRNHIVQRGQLFTPTKTIEGFSDVHELIEHWNSGLYWKHLDQKIIEFKGHLYIESYETETYNILQELSQLSSSGVDNYVNFTKDWFSTTNHGVDCKEKHDAIRFMFEHSKVVLVYGAAGTGKSTLIKHVADLFKDEDKLFIANTNPAVDNMKRKVDAPNCQFKTIAKHLWASSDSHYGLMVVDECSTVSNEDMLAVLRATNFELLLLVGDIFQIESILFGNWFCLAKSFVPESSVFGLTIPYRSENDKLIELWKRVRSIEDNLLEHIARNGFSTSLNESLFQTTNTDEIILCLNYDGLYGINNVNRFLQSSNSSPEIEWGTNVYKEGDPIIFNEVKRFSPLIYNNLKGRILEAHIEGDKIWFITEIDKIITPLHLAGLDCSFEGTTDNGNSAIGFYVDKHRSTDEDDDGASKTVVPFQISYAVSIHKAQGLEYNSVKVVITDEVEERISHNIFYTAITRAREHLKIYWTPETENHILKNLKSVFNDRDEPLLRLNRGIR